MMKLFRAFSCLMLLLGGLGCSTEFDPTAEPKEIWVVYGVITPSDTVQYIRIAKGFLPESDAFAYAQENDQSVQGLTVTLTEAGTGKVLEAEEVDSVVTMPQDGLFYPFITLYKVRTIGSDRLRENTSYELTVREPGNDTPAITATTEIPETPNISNPNLPGGPGGTRCLLSIPIQAEYTMFFGESAGASSYEIRVVLDYTANGEEKQAIYGPTSMFTSDVRCQSAGSNCYKFEEKVILRSLLRQIDAQPEVDYRYGATDGTSCRSNIDNLPSVFNFEVTAMDVHVTRYRQVNEDRLTEGNTVANQYTNLEGREGEIVLGIFGSYALRQAKARMSPCAEYLLGLNGTPAPTGTTCEP
jgi:hypothetical protein